MAGRRSTGLRLAKSLFRDTGRDVAFPTIGAAILFAALVGGGLAYTAVVGGSAERLITAMLIDAVMVIGIQIYVGNTGILSFGHVGFGAVAGYTFAILAISAQRKSVNIGNAPFGLADVQLSPLASTVVAVAITLVVALIVGLGLARSGARSGAVSATVITLALLFVTHELATSWSDLTGGNRAGLSFGIGRTLDSRLPIYAVLAGSILVARLFAQSRTGRLAHAAREDNLAARAMGVDPLVQQMAALLISVLVVSLAAVLRVYEIGNILPGFFFFDYTLLTLVMLIVGGRNSVSGAVLGVVVITAGRELTRRLASDGYELFGLGLDDAPLDWVFREGLPTVFLGLAMLGFMILRPSGLLEDRELDTWLASRWARRSAGLDGEPAPMPEQADRPATSIDVAGVDVSFGGFKALSDVSITAGSNEIVGIIGPNGAGKTTLVNVITGLVEHQAGRFSIGGTDVTGQPTHRLSRDGLVRTFQNLRLFPALTVRENVEVSARVAEVNRRDRPPPDVDALIAEAGLWDHRDRRARELDYGNSRRLELARAAATSPSFLLLDEPTSGMSDAESAAMVEQVRHMAAVVGAGVVVIDHDLNFITGISDRIYVLDQGRVIAEGTPDEVQADSHVQAAYLGTSATD